MYIHIERAAYILIYSAYTVVDRDVERYMLPVQMENGSPCDVPQSVYCFLIVQHESWSFIKQTEVIRWQTD
jgi:hypothetical protein